MCRLRQHLDGSFGWFVYLAKFFIGKQGLFLGSGVVRYGVSEELRRRGDIDTLRSCIVAEEGYTYLSLDASQIELRVLAILSKDPQMLEDLESGDLHMGTAIRMFGFTEDKDEMKKRRYKAKQGNFAMVYGADSYKLSEMLECSIEEAEEFMAEHKAAYPVLYVWMDARVAQAKEDGYVISMFGRIRPIPELYDARWKIRQKAEREVVNTEVQGTAVDIIKLAMLYMRSILDKSIRLVLNVHDEIVFESPDELLPNALEQCKELQFAFPTYPFSVSIGKCYGELKEVKYE